ncbi:response regulator transcription factor [Hazenella sp. IB182357]|uniref:Response regulator transcription factor n=1 Tax=Polycladospora coralii TaxID=2771432 RepID=A0A926NBA6_9BACL|nr:response regulator transcription factor [Polycladospora coralii]MBD1373388.1 response regulator transcription factor [Polycladospora coralii]MBS7531614.1 response regulator transcription factor [Polycladospora coralii]
MKFKILIVDDEVKILQTVAEYLILEAFDVVTESSSLNAIRRIRMEEKYDLILLDWMMPDKNGLEVCKEIRKYSDIPIIFLTAKSDEYDLLLGLELGADDYIKKPFSMRELVTRIRVILRRVKSGLLKKPENTSLRYGKLELDKVKCKVFLSDEEIICTTTELKLLETLMMTPERVFTRAQLLEASFGDAYAGYERTIDTHIHNLRKKIKQVDTQFEGIETVFGLGYRMGGSDAI